MDFRKEKEYTRQFDRALRIRNSGDLHGALWNFKKLTREYNDPWLYIIIGDIYDQLDDMENRLSYNKKAVELAPELEQASLGLFFSLWDNDQPVEALDEMKRFLRIKDSDEYRNILKEMQKDSKQDGNSSD